MTSPSPSRSPLRAAGWALGSGMVHQLSQVSVSLALAALLGPEAFGVIALATIYMVLVEFLVRQGIVQAVIQRQDLDDEHLDAAFWMTMGTAALLGAFTLVFADLWADINDAPSLRPLLMALSGMALFQAMWQVPTAILQRELDFRRSEVPLNIGTAVGGAVGVVAALLGAEEWSIVAQLYTYGVVGTVLLYRATSWRPRFRFSRGAARDLFAVSSGALLATLGSFFAQRADSLLLGVFFGPLALGLYRLGARFVQLVINVTAASLGRVALAVLSREKGGPEAYGRQLRQQLLGLNLMVFPALGILLACSRSIVLIFGDEWEPAGPTLQVLCLAGLSQAVVLFCSPILQSLGKAYRAASTQWFSAGAHVATLVIGGILLRDSDVETQVVGVATVRLLTQSLVITPVLLVVLGRATQVPVRGLLSPLAAPAIGAAAAIGAGLLVEELCHRGDLPVLVTLILVGMASSAAAGVAVLAASAHARDLVGRYRRKLVQSRAS